MSGPTTGFLLIADITGYTAYLSESELDHAQGTLTAVGHGARQFRGA